GYIKVTRRSKGLKVEVAKSKKWNGAARRTHDAHTRASPAAFGKRGRVMPTGGHHDAHKRAAQQESVAHLWASPCLHEHKVLHEHKDNKRPDDAHKVRAEPDGTTPRPGRSEEEIACLKEKHAAMQALFPSAWREMARGDVETHRAADDSGSEEES